MKDFKAFLLKDEAAQAKMAALKTEVQEFSKNFNMPGFEER